MNIHTLLALFHDPDKKHSPCFKVTKIISFLIVLLILLLLVKCCQALFASKSPKATYPMFIRKGETIIIPEHSPLRTQLIVQSVKVSREPHRVFLPGIVEADPTRTVNVLPPLTGRLIDLKINLGDEVKRDQILASLQSSGLAQAYSDRMKALGILKQAKEALVRAQKVNQAGANSVKDLELIQSNYTQALAEVQRTQSIVKSLGQNKQNILYIRAPIDGKVLTINYGLGSYINDATIPILTLSNIQSIWVDACVPEHLVALVTKGIKTTISLTAYPHQTWEGQVTYVSNIIDPNTRCNQTRIALMNPLYQLQPNMFATVAMELPQEEHAMIPLSAIIMDNDTTSVYVEIAPWTFVSRAVTLGDEDQNLVRITSGLKRSDRIVVSGGILVND